MRMNTFAACVALLLLPGFSHRRPAVRSLAGLRTNGAMRSSIMLAADEAKQPSAPAKPKQKSQPSAPKHPATATGGHTTIAPFPVPGDTSRAATERRKIMNLPKSGITTIAPLPVPPGAMWDPYLLGSIIPPQQVDVFPEQTSTVWPSYPKAARDAGIHGIVLVGAHVRTDGIVDSVRVIRSIAGLDSAAVAAVRQWRFKPASYQGKPVAVWTGIPVKFSLH